MSFSLAGEGNITIDWGDGMRETHEIGSNSQFSHQYAGVSVRTVTITGKGITKLTCMGFGSLTSLDVSKCTSLKELRCGGEFTSLDVSKNIALTKLSCGSDKLTSLDVSKNIALTELILYQCFNLTSLDVSKNIALTELRCGGKLTSLIVSNSPQLKKLSCSENQLTSLDVSGCPQLKELNCEKNQLTSWNASNCPQLEKLYCRQNQLTSLDVSGCPQLKELDCTENQLTNSALDDLFRTLPNNGGWIHFHSNPGADNCDRSILKIRVGTSNVLYIHRHVFFNWCVRLNHDFNKIKKISKIVWESFFFVCLRAKNFS